METIKNTKHTKHCPFWTEWKGKAGGKSKEERQKDADI